MQRAPGEERLFRVAYGDGELEFMLQPWFDIDVGGARQPHDIVIVGIGQPDDADLASALRAANAARDGVREGGAMVIAAQLGDGEGTGAGAVADGIRQRNLVVVAASESPEIVRLAKLRAAVDVEEALDIAYEHIGRPRRASVLLVPRASVGRADDNE